MALTVTLEKSDLVSLVAGTTPNYNLFDNATIKKCGYYTGGHYDRWTWGSGLEDLSETELWELYKLIKKNK